MQEKEVFQENASAGLDVTAFVRSNWDQNFALTQDVHTMGATRTSLAIREITNKFVSYRYGTTITSHKHTSDAYNLIHCKFS